jgi:hypothetical protein
VVYEAGGPFLSLLQGVDKQQEGRHAGPVERQPAAVLREVIGASQTFLFEDMAWGDRQTCSIVSSPNRRKLLDARSHARLRKQ